MTPLFVGFWAKIGWMNPLVNANEIIKRKLRTEYLLSHFIFAATVTRQIRSTSSDPLRFEWRSRSHKIALNLRTGENQVARLFLGASRKQESVRGFSPISVRGKSSGSGKPAV